MDNSRKASVSANHESFTSLKKLLNEQNSFSICSLSSVFVAIPIRPHNCMLLRVFHSPAANISRHSPKLKPNLVSSSAMCSCNRQLTTFPAFGKTFVLGSHFLYFAFPKYSLSGAIGFFYRFIGVKFGDSYQSHPIRQFA